MIYVWIHEIMSIQSHEMRRVLDHDAERPTKTACVLESIKSNTFQLFASLHLGVDISILLACYYISSGNGLHRSTTMMRVTVMQSFDTVFASGGPMAHFLRTELYPSSIRQYTL